MSTFTAAQTPAVMFSPNATNGNSIPQKMTRKVMIPRSMANAAGGRGGNPRRKLVGAATAIAFASLFCLLQVSVICIDFVEASKPYRFPRLESCRGGEIDDFLASSISPTPPIDFAHGTTTISFLFQGGIVAAVDSRASIGSFVGSKTTQKVLPVSKYILGTMAGGAADCSYWIRFLRKESKIHEVHDGRAINVARAARILSSILYENRGLDLSVGTMIMGYDDRDGFSIYYIDNTGVKIRGDMFAVGSGSTFALGILDTEERKFDMTEEEAVSLGIKAIRHATLRDAASGGFIGVYLINERGWRKVFSQDLAKAV
jgi:20S proteasome subunit beta 5